MTDQQQDPPPLGAQVVITADAEVIRGGKPVDDDNGRDTDRDEEQQ